jgi:hypothetical protein
LYSYCVTLDYNIISSVPNRALDYRGALGA